MIVVHRFLYKLYKVGDVHETKNIAVEVNFFFHEQDIILAEKCPVGPLSRTFLDELYHANLKASHTELLSNLHARMIHGTSKEEACMRKIQSAVAEDIATCASARWITPFPLAIDVQHACCLYKKYWI